ncbi:hypothetical protein MBLNU459_g4253t2 [Dothideomycetes sp. NU459]
MYPDDWYIDEANPTPRAKLLMKARDEYKVHLVPIHVQRFAGEAVTWADSFTKLLAFNQTQYDRIIIFDSDVTVLQPMDELFFLPRSTIAMPRAYWLDDNTLTSVLAVVEPSDVEYRRVQNAIADRKYTDYDMEVMNSLYGHDCLVLPHRGYILLSGEFRGKDHSKYLGSEEELWNGRKVFADTKLVHFSDWPIPKPWLHQPQATRLEVEPKCRVIDADGEDCTDRDIWNGLYSDFRQRREDVCGEWFRVPGELVRSSTPQGLSPSEPSRLEPVRKPPTTVRRVDFRIAAHDQGWSSYARDEGTRDNSWTWFEVGVFGEVDGRRQRVDPAAAAGGEGSRRLVTNLQAVREVQEHHVVVEDWECEWMHRLREGDQVMILAQAWYAGWRNFVHAARIDVHTSCLLG